MAGSGRRVFQPGEVLTASNVMNYLQDQAVMVFAGTAARGSAIGTAVAEGMTSYLADTNTIQTYTGSVWEQVFPALTGSIVQTVSVNKSDTFSSTSTTSTAITGLAASITPRTATNKVMVVVTLMVAESSGTAFQTQLYRGATLIGAGDAAGSRSRVSNSTFIEAGGQRSFSFSFLDSPATTSSTTYSVNGFAGAGTWYINRSSADVDGAAYVRASSTITLFEVSA